MVGYILARCPVLPDHFKVSFTLGKSRAGHSSITCQYSFFWEGGEKAADVYYFNFCNRLDSIGHDRTEHEMNKGIAFDLGAAPEKRLVFDLKQIGKKAIWFDRHLHAWAGAWISDELKRALESEVVSGINFQQFPETHDL